MKLHEVARVISGAALIVAWAVGQAAIAQCGDGAHQGVSSGSGRRDLMVVGVVTDVSRLCVGGLTLQVDRETSVSVDGKIASLDALMIGHVTVIAASRVGNVFKAVRIAIVHEVVGPVTDVDATGSELGVMGRRVVLRTNAKDAPGSVRLESLKLDDMVRVSGLRRGGGEIDGTLIELALPSDQGVAYGRITMDAERSPALAGVRVRFAESVGGDPGANDKEFRVTGRWTGRELVAEEVSIDPIGSLLDRSGHVLLQGYLGNDGSGISLAGMRIHLSKATRFEGGDRKNLRPDAEVILTGSMRSGRHVDVERIHIGATRPGSDRRIILK